MYPQAPTGGLKIAPAIDLNFDHAVDNQHKNSSMDWKQNRTIPSTSDASKTSQFRLANFEMANNTTWQISHYLVIVIHLIMFIAGIATFVINGQKLNPDSTSSIDKLNADLNAKTVVWAVAGVGIAGLICTALVFWRLLYLQRVPPAGITQEAYYLKRKIAYVSSITLLGCLVIADIASGAAVAGKVHYFGDLAAPVAFAFIAAIISLATLVTDSLQLREYSQQNMGRENGVIEEVEMPQGGYGYSGV